MAAIGVCEKVATMTKQGRDENAMSDRQKPAGDQHADVLDVHLVDVAAQIEALLRGLREAQKHVLRLRGALKPLDGEDPVDSVRRRIDGMLTQSEALKDALQAAAEAAAGGPAPPRTNGAPRSAQSPRRST